MSLSQEQKIDALYNTIMDPDSGLRALNHRVYSLEKWRTGIVAAGAAVFSVGAAGYQLLLAKISSVK